MTTLNQLIDEYLQEVWRRDPVVATDAGIHTFDDQLPNFDPDVLKANDQQDREFRSRFRSFDPATLNQDESLDRMVALANLERSIADSETIRPWQRNPGPYVATVIQGIYSLIEREHAPFEERMRSMLSRLRQAPAVLRQAQTNLTDDTPPIFAVSALQHMEGAISFLETTIPELARQVPKLEKEIIQANQSTLAAFAEYKNTVGRLAQEGQGQFPVGKDYYNFLLRDHHLLSLDCDELLELGQQSIAEIQSDLEATARQIDPNKNWLEITDELKRDHPPTEGVLDMYTQEVALSKAFIIDKDLVTVPKDEGFWVSWVPPFMWATLPFHASYPPRPFEKDNKGFWRITPPDPNTSPEEQEQKLRGHNRWNARALAMHEGYPGHHMHFCRVKLLPSKIRRQFWDPVFTEGWALYTEDLMWESGFFEDPRGRLIQLVNALWRAVRVVAGVSLHTRGMSLQQSVDMLVNISQLGRINATIETNRFAATPTYTVSYHLGKVLIKRLRQAYKTKKGNAFDLKVFHDQLLSYGAISPDIVRQLMLADESPV